MTYSYPAGFKPIRANINAGCRYSLEISTPNPASDLTLFVLMMNPSVADGTSSDRTINTILNARGNLYRKVVVVNTTPVIETDSSKLKTRISDIHKNALPNAKAIEHMVKTAGHFHFLVATGEVIKGVNDDSYIKLMNQIDYLTVGDGLYVVKLTAKGYGGHPLYKPKAMIENLTHVRKADDQWHLKIV